MLTKHVIGSRGWGVTGIAQESVSVGGIFLLYFQLENYSCYISNILNTWEEKSAVK